LRKRGRDALDVGRGDTKSESVQKGMKRGERRHHRALWSERAAPMRSNNEYGEVNNEKGSSDPCRMQRMQLQENKNSGKQRTGLPK